MARIQCKETNVLLQAIYSRTDLSSPSGKTDGSAIRPYHLLLATNRAGTGDVFFNRRIARIANFSSAGNGDFQGLGDTAFSIPCARCGDFSSPGFYATCLSLARSTHISA